jgi:hypothetical protein
MTDNTIVLMASKDTGHVTAVVSFFQNITYGVLLGRTQSLQSQSTVIFLDPHADHPPDDISMVKEKHCILEIKKPDPLQSHLIRMASEGTAPDGVSILIRKIDRWKFEAETGPLLQRLNSAREQPETLHLELEVVLTELTGYIFRLLSHLSRTSIESFEGKPENEPIIQVLKHIAAQDGDRKQGVSELTEYCIYLAMDALGDELARNLEKGPIELDFLWKLLRTTEGFAIVTPVLMGQLFSALRRAAEANTET